VKSGCEKGREGLAGASERVARASDRWTVMKTASPTEKRPKLERRPKADTGPINRTKPEPPRHARGITVDGGASRARVSEHEGGFAYRS
jgi:hypothetical protein